MSLAHDLRLLIGQLKRRLREQATIGDFTASQIAVLLRLEREGPTTGSALAKAEGMRSQSMGAHLATLQEAGLVSSTPDPSDGRQTLWKLTPPARERLESGRLRREDWLTEVLETRLTPAERDELARALVLLQRII